MFLRLGGLFSVAIVFVWLWAIFDSATSVPDKVRHLPKPLWVVIVVFGLLPGAIAWFIFGRPRVAAGAQRERTLGGWDGGAWRGESTQRTREVALRPKSPDDDPDFLKRLDEELRRRPPDSNR